MSDNAPLRRLGAIWKAKAGAKSLESGTVTVNGWRQRFLILKNKPKKPGSSKQPDYVLLSSEDPPTLHANTE